LPTVNTIPLKTYRKALEKLGLNCIREKGGHETWSRTNLERPIVFSAHHKEILGMQVKANCRSLGISVNAFMKLVNSL